MLAHPAEGKTRCDTTTTSNKNKNLSFEFVCLYSSGVQQTLAVGGGGGAGKSARARQRGRGNVTISPARNPTPPTARSAWGLCTGAAHVFVYEPPNDSSLRAFTRNCLGVAYRLMAVRGREGKGKRQRGRATPDGAETVARAR